MITGSSSRISQDIQRQVKLSSQIARTSIEISGGKKILQPSDDPLAAARVASIRQAQSNSSAWQSNIALGLSLSDQAGSVMALVSDRIDHARELMVSGANAPLSNADRATLASELRSLAAEFTSLAATRTASGEPLFATGAALKFRFNETLTFAPVPSAAEAFEVGGVSFAQLALDAATAIEANNTAQIGVSLTALDGGIAKAADVSAEIGVRGVRMTNLREQYINDGVSLTAERSGLEDTDLSQAIALLNQQSITLDAARAAFARINRSTLFDLLR